MWKKLDDGSNQAPGSSAQMPQATAEAELPVGIDLDSDSENDNSSTGPQKVIAERPAGPSGVVEFQRPPLTAATMAAYTEAVNEFTKNATSFIGYLPLLSEARSAYEQAMRTSEELRKDLDSGDEKLRALMTQLEQMVKVHLVRPAADKKKPEPSKSGQVTGTDGAPGGRRPFL
jgi:hypothetical protein